MFRHCDCDLQALVDSTVPPVDLDKVGAFRYAVQKYQKQAAS